jgi:putative endonuclease
MKIYWVYILTNRSNKTLYVGMTNNLTRRLAEHRAGTASAFTKKYNVTKLVYYESTSEVESAIAREKELKGWLRKRKGELVETTNPLWDNLGSTLSP